MSDIAGVISELEERRAAIEKALTALREITSSQDEGQLRKRRGRPAGQKRTALTNSPQGASSPLKRRTLSAKQKQAISRAWTPERKRRFAEFHVQRMARLRGEDPSKALREYRRRKQTDATDSRSRKPSGRVRLKSS